MSDVEPPPEFWLLIATNNDDYLRASTFLNRHPSFGWTSASRYIDMILKCVCRGFGLDIPQGRVPNFVRFPPTQSYFLAKTSDSYFAPFTYKELLGLEILIGRGMERFIQQVTVPSDFQAKQPLIKADAAIHTLMMQQMEVVREEVVESREMDGDDVDVEERGDLGDWEETMVGDEEMDEGSLQEIENEEQVHDNAVQTGEDEAHDHNGQTNDEMEEPEDGENLFMRVFNTIVSDTYDDVANASLPKQQRQEVDGKDGERKEAEGGSTYSQSLLPTFFNSLASTDNIITAHFDETNFDPKCNHPLAQHVFKRKRNDSNISTRGSEQLQNDEQQDESDNLDQLLEQPVKRARLEVMGNAETGVEVKLRNTSKRKENAENPEQEHDKISGDTLKIKTDAGDTSSNESELNKARRSLRIKDWITKFAGSSSSKPSDSASVSTSQQPQPVKKQQNSIPAATSSTSRSVKAKSVNAKSVSVPTPTSATSSSKGSITCDICNNIVNKSNFKRHVRISHLKKRYHCSAPGCDYTAPLKFYIITHNKNHHGGIAPITDVWDQNDFDMYESYKKKFH